MFDLINFVSNEPVSITWVGCYCVLKPRLTAPKLCSLDSDNASIYCLDSISITHLLICHIVISYHYNFIFFDCLAHLIGLHPFVDCCISCTYISCLCEELVYTWLRHNSHELAKTLSTSCIHPLKEEPHEPLSMPTNYCIYVKWNPTV